MSKTCRLNSTSYNVKTCSYKMVWWWTLIEYSPVLDTESEFHLFREGFYWEPHVTLLLRRHETGYNNNDLVLRNLVFRTGKCTYTNSEVNVLNAVLFFIGNADYSNSRYSIMNLFSRVTALTTTHCSYSRWLSKRTFCLRFYASRPHQ